MQYSTTHRTNAMTQLATDVGASCVIKVFTGSMPANCATADTGTLLATFAGNATQYGTAASGALTVSAIANTTGAATGTAGYVRVYPTAATTTNAVIQGTAALSGGDFNFTNLSITSGQAVAFTSQTITAFGA